jgi:hypothetical protein
MPQSHLLRTISAIFMLILSSLQAGQTPSSIKQDAKNSPCSNIVALAGDVKLDCSSLTPKQQQIIESIPVMLRTIIANQLDPKAVMDKLEEIAKAVHDLDPKAPRITYMYDGDQRIERPGSVGSNPQNPAHQAYLKIIEAHQRKDWQSVASLSDEAIKETPEWLTPYVYRILAYGNLDKITLGDAISSVEDLKKKADGNPDYEYLIKQCDEILKQLRPRVSQQPATH